MPDLSLIETLLRKLEARDHLSLEEREMLLAAAGEEVTYAKDADLVREGDHPTSSILVTAGFTTRYRVLADGQQQITALHVPGDFVDLHGFILKQMDHSVGALTACRAVLFPHQNLKRITEQAPHLTRVLWLATLIDSAIHREWIVGMGRRTADQQIAHLLCELYVRLGVVRLTSGDTFELPMTQTELADAMGLSAVHVNRVLQRLRNLDLFTWQGQSVRVLDWPGLQQLAEFNPGYLHLNVEPR